MPPEKWKVSSTLLMNSGYNLGTMICNGFVKFLENPNA